jgi:lipopolysaccharide/colanic/teichoic acid biosynthesis glycosyltransferase
VKEQSVGSQSKGRGYYLTFKRGMDVLFAMLLLVIGSPILLLTVLLIAIERIVKGLALKVFFIQQRPGRKAKIFSLYKLRTMEEDNRIVGPIALLFRKLGLDEWPQLINIIKGDMSFVGPRPLLIQYLPHYSEREGRRHEVLPGITGLAQVNGRNAQTWESRFKYDIDYVDNQSFTLDLKILFLTVKQIFFRSGNRAEMERWR